jgi:hypothetical protein
VWRPPRSSINAIFSGVHSLGVLDDLVASIRFSERFQRSEYVSYRQIQRR